MWLYYVRGLWSAIHYTEFITYIQWALSDETDRDESMVSHIICT